MESIFNGDILSLPWFIVLAMASACVALFVTRNKTPKYLPPGPTGWPILGYLPSLDTKKPLHSQLTKLAEQYGEIFSMYLGSRLVVVINSYDALQDTFVRQSKKFAGRPEMPTFNETKGGDKRGVSLSDFTPAYRQHRKVMQQSIHSLLSNQKDFQSSVQSECHRMVEHLKTKVGQEFAPLDTIRAVVSSAFLRFTFGSRHEYDDPQLLKLVYVFEDWFEAAESSNPVDFLPPLRYLPNKTLEVAQSIGETVDNFCKTMVEKALRGELETKNTMVLSFLEQLQSSQNQLNVNQCASILTDLLGAGFDTVAVSMAWAVIYLTRNAHVVKQIREELKTVLGNDELQCSDSERLPFCHATILEVLRKTTVAPLGLPHKTLDDVQVGNFIIPKDTTVLPNLWKINHDEEAFEKPYSFNPWRFLECQNNNENDLVIKSNERKDCTFSAGVRRCPGKRMAFAELFMFLVTLVRHFDIEMICEPIDDESEKGLTLKPKPYKIKLHHTQAS